MATGKQQKKVRTSSAARQGDGNARTSRFKTISQSSSQIVQDAASLLDDEIASGIVAAKQMQQRFSKDRHIDSTDFKDALNRFQGDAHEVVNMLNDQFPQLRSDDNEQLVKRFTSNAHSLLDLFVELVNMGAEIADQLAQSNLPKKPDTGNGKSRR